MERSLPLRERKKYKKYCYLKGDITPVEQDSAAPNSPDDPLNILDIGEEDPAALVNAMTNARKFFMKSKPHIKEYQKVRAMHSEIVSDMMAYFESGKFVHEIDSSYLPAGTGATYHEVNFDTDTREGEEGLCEYLFYKHSPKMNSITEEFIKIRRYRNPNKIAFLQSILDSKLGLFEVVKADMHQAYVQLKEVITGAEYDIVDFGMSGNPLVQAYYVYTRIITFQNTSFSTGLGYLFSKNDSFTGNFIRDQKNDYNPEGDLGRFIQLYNQFTIDPDSPKVTKT